MDWIIALILAGGLIAALLIVAAVMDHREKKREDQKKRDKVQKAVDEGKKVTHNPQTRTTEIDHGDGNIEVLTWIAVTSLMDSDSSVGFGDGASFDDGGDAGFGGFDSHDSGGFDGGGFDGGGGFD